MRKLFFLAMLFFASATALFAQSNNDPAWKYAESITEQNLKDVLTIIASDQMQGRETGTEGQRRAAIYISNEFRAMGLKAPAGLIGYEQKYPLYRDSMMRQNVTIGQKELVPFTDFIMTAGSAASADVKNSEIEFVGYGIEEETYSDYKGKNVKGKVVVALMGEPKDGDNYIVSGTNRMSRWSFDRDRKVQTAAEKGASAIILVNLRMPELPRYYSNNTARSNFYFPRETAGGSIPMVYAIPSVLNEIFTPAQIKEITDRYNSLKPMNTLKYNAKRNTQIVMAQKRFSVLASNILGVVEGTDLKDEYVFLTAHYDHLGVQGGEIYHGADDDGSGTTAVIEMARAFKKAKDEGHGPRRTIVFMTVSGEEKGLWGSEYYSDHPVYPLDKTTVDLNIDMIGRIDPNRTEGDSMNYVYVIGNDKLSSDLDPIAKNVNDKYLNMELDFKFNAPDDPERIYYRSDHYNFARKGVPIIFYFDGIHKDYHKPSDTVEKINFDLMLKRTQYVFLTAWEIANRDNMLIRDIPLPEGTR